MTKIFYCDELPRCRVDHVSSRPCVELTVSSWLYVESTVCRVYFVSRWLVSNHYITWCHYHITWMHHVNTSRDIFNVVLNTFIRDGTWNSNRLVIIALKSYKILNGDCSLSVTSTWWPIVQVLEVSNWSTIKKSCQSVGRSSGWVLYCKGTALAFPDLPLPISSAFWFLVRIVVILMSDEVLINK